MNGGDLPVISETNCRPGFGSDTKYNDFFSFQAPISWTRNTKWVAHERRKFADVLRYICSAIKDLKKKIALYFNNFLLC